MYIWGDFHTHTVFSHGRDTVRDNACFAARQGLLALAISDHGPANYWIGVNLAQKLQSMRAEVEAAQRQNEISVFLGVEANIVDLDGSIDVPEEIITELDLLLVGLHSGVRPRNFSSGIHILWRNPLSRYHLASRSRARLLNTEALVSAVERYPVDIITHPGYNFAVDTIALARVAARRGTLLEINANHLRRTWPYVSAAAQAQASFVINSDAHRYRKVGVLEEAVSFAANLGLGPERVFNLSPNREEACRRCEQLAKRGRKKEGRKRILPGEIIVKEVE